LWLIGIQSFIEEFGWGAYTKRDHIGECGEMTEVADKFPQKIFVFLYP
jgi:hypothetical protein